VCADDTTGGHDGTLRKSGAPLPGEAEWERAVGRALKKGKPPPKAKKGKAASRQPLKRRRRRTDKGR